MSEPTLDPSVEIDENEIIAQRQKKLAQLREHAWSYPNGFVRQQLTASIIEHHNDETQEELKAAHHEVSIAGRIMLRRIMGKASFVHIQDMSGRLQLYIRRDDLPEGVYQGFKQWDLGDIVGAKGYLFKTNTGELSVHVTELNLLTKSLRPLPDKFHGLTDLETRYRRRYVDLIANEQARKTFSIRSKLLYKLREYMTTKGFMEVETPMMQPLPGGAAARPFVTHHNTLDMDLYLRIAPELYLKRLVVGGFEKVYEVNRNFRNEGMSTQHNPEFTMLEFYEAYATYQDMMNFTENLFKFLAQEVLGTQQITYQEKTFDFGKPFHRLTMRDAILQFNPELTPAAIDDADQARAYAEKLEVSLKDSDGLGKIQLEIYEKTVESKLIEPTFITQYPAEVSPLARRNDQNPFVTDRFELIIAGREIANGFSELNDPHDQAERFKQQVREKDAGDIEAMPYDEDYITALEYGLPPTAGEGIGIDRLVMLFTDSASIRDVILFPLMRGVKS